jgi:riboflavin kinase / FMN adenylyltransferase
VQRVRVDEPVPPELRGAAIALGNFDGVHCGHQAVLAATHGTALRAAALFEPHPRQFFAPSTPPFRLQTNAQRARALSVAGMDAAFEIVFADKLATMTDATFVRVVLSDWLGACRIVAGFDFRFGRGRMGNAQSLVKYAGALGIEVAIIDELDDSAAADKISSSAIRAAIAEGRLKDAGRLLGRPWAIEGVVQHGFKRGRELGFPTLNVSLGDYTTPRLGVYATETDLGDGVWRPGVSSCGLNPTVGQLQTPILETHLFDFSDDCYGRTVETRLLCFQRPEAKYSDVEALRIQIEQDAQAARDYFSAV